MHCFGSYLGSGLISYAADEQNKVTFDAKILNAENKEVTQADITEELKLHLNIAVQEGTLKDINLNLDNCNFKLKDEKSLDQIKAGEIDLAIVAKNEDSFKLDLLNMENKIKLTARYLKDNETSQIEKEKTIQLKWNSENLNTMNEEERKETKILNTEIITNKTYAIEGEQKRVIQVKIQSGIKNNIYPIEKTILTINPIQEGKIEGEEFKNGTNIVAEEVEVSAYSTKATNGQDGSINFGTIEENKLGSWQYDSESGKITITVNNNKDENNKVAWAKNAVDEFVVTYIYKEESIKDVEALKAEVETNIKLYTDEGEHKKTVSVWKANSEKERPMELNVQVPESISKKYILQGREFTETYTLNISTTKVGELILVTSNLDELNISDSKDVQPSTTYKTAYISKEEFLNILGSEGEIVFFDYPNMNLIGEITIESLDSNNENLLSISYPENLQQIGMMLSKPIKAGKLNIQNTKILNISNVPDYINNIDQIEKLTLNSIAGLAGKEGGAVFTTERITKEIALTNPETNIELGIDLGQDKTTLPVGEKNTIDFTVALKTSGENDRLFNNPTLKIELPQEVQELQVIESTKQIANANGLQVASYEIKNNIIEIKLTGNQAECTDYNGQDTIITFSAEVSTQKQLPTFTSNIKLTVVNEEEEKTSVQEVTFSAEKGILLANSISNYNGTEPTISAFKNEEKSGLLNSQAEQEITATGKGTIINNTGLNLENAIVIGKGNIKVAMNDAEIAYTKDEEVTVASNWDITEYSQEVTGYKITLPTMENGATKEFTYELTIPENLGANKTIELQYSVYNKTEEIASPKIVLVTEQEVKLELNVEPTAKNGDTVYEEDTLTYSITVKNVGETVARNIQINNTIPEGTTLLEENQTSWTIEKLEAGKSVTKDVTVKVNNLSQEETEKTITNTVIVKANYLNEELINKISNKVKKSEIKIETTSIYGDIIYEGDVISHALIITNTTSKTMKNVKVTRHLADETIYYGMGLGAEIEGLTYEFNDDSNVAIWNIPEIPANESIKLNLKSIAKNLEEGKNEQKLIYSFDIEYDNNKKISKSVCDGVIVKPNLDLKLTTSKEKLKIGEDAVYTLEIKNTTNYDIYSDINLNLPDGLLVKSTNILKEGEEIENQEADQYISNIAIEKNKSIKIVIIANVTDSFNEDTTIKATATATVWGRNNDGRKDNIEKVFSKTVETTLDIIEVPQEPQEPTPEPENPLPSEEPNTPTPENPDTPTPDNPSNPEPEDPETPTEKTYTISGTAWLDENEDGKKDDNEQLLKGILVKIKQIDKNKVAEYIKDENGEEIYAITNNKGQYEFTNLEAGKYILEFKYNTKTYKLTQVANKDSVPYEATTSEGTIVKTDTITISNSNIQNINIGLVLNSTFDLELNKYITRAVVQNSSGTTEYKYNKEKLAKVEIKAKQMASSTVLIEYVIEVKNSGAVPGAVQLIADYLPKELKFSSEMNTNWYQGTDGNLYTEELKNVTIEPGETKQVSLVLTKSMTENNTGTFTNAAEIYEDKNDFGLVDTNSTPANKEEKENDYSTAQIIISTATGSPIMYIGIVIACMLILGGGIYIINKKVINGKQSI